MTGLGAPIVLTAGAVAAAVGGQLLSGDSSHVVQGFSIDSRAVRRGDLFIAIRGERYDGSAFAGASLRAGACGVMVRGAPTTEPPATPRDVIVIAVPDTTEALQTLGQYVRRASGSRVTAITGSAGKTTTKETAAELLATRYTVYRNPGNFNNHIGLPLSLLDLRTRPDVAVVELGMNHPGEISRLVDIAEPDVRVWTNVGDAHLGFFSSPDAIADAKAEILERSTADTVLVANADDARVMRHARRFPGRLVTFGATTGADVHATHVSDLGVDGTEARVRTPDGEADLRVPLVGRGNLMNVLAAIAVAHVHGVPLSGVAARIASLRPSKHRGEVVPLRDGVTLLDDSYNSSPSALMQTLEVVARDRRHARKVAVLGEMLELGAFARALHVECGHAAVRAGVSLLITAGGPPADAMAAAAREAGLDEHAAVHVASSAEAADRLLGRLAPNDLVLVKGSRGIGTDLVVARLLAEWS
jgi:UDP-N-acetylmuramoyl-tripeptide--D-alanyl-D-alanine ligase